MQKKVVAIIGGGAAGMMTAASLLTHETNAEIHIFEKNSKLGAKVLISGGGRCNVTTGLRDKKTLLTKYIHGSKFLGSHALKVFSPKKCFDWFQGQGVPLKVEDDLRVFPVSNDGKDIVGVFEKLFHQHHVDIHFNEGVDSISLRHGPIVCNDGCPREKNFLIVTNKSMYQADYLVVTTGGNAYAHTGSTGDGYSFAATCGHTITPLGPSLNSFLSKESWPENISGVSFPQASVSTTLSDGTVKKETGPILFTHFGITGPAIFALSAHMSQEKVSKKEPATICINIDAHKSFEQREKEIFSLMQQHEKKELKTVLGLLLPKRFVETLLHIADISPIVQAAHVSKEQRKQLAHLLSGKLSLTLIARRPGDEFVTSGGVSLDEVNPSTMESQRCSGLYFAGEILNIDGVTGGFNLQSSWATGWVAGKSIAKNN